MKPILLALAMFAVPAAAAVPEPPGAPVQAAESEEAAIERIFYPAFQLRMMLSGPIDRNAITRDAFVALGAERACSSYRQAWRSAFDAHLPAWKQAYHAAVKSVVPRQALFTEPRRFMDPAVVDVYSPRVVSALEASGVISIMRTMGSEILTSLRSAAGAAPPAAGPAEFDPAAPGGLANKCGVTMEYLEGKDNALGS